MQNFGNAPQAQATPPVGHDSHAHSPRRRRVHTIGNNCCPGHSFPGPRPSTAVDMPDPFVDSQNLRSTPVINPPPLNSQSLFRGPSPQGKSLELRIPDDQLARLVEALSPRARSRYVTPNEQANQLRPPNNDTSSQPSIMSGPLFDPKLNAAAGARQTAPTQISVMDQGATLWDSIHASNALDGKHVRDPTDISMHMGCTDFPNCNHDGPSETQPATDSPAKYVKGKKEGSGCKEKGK